MLVSLRVRDLAVLEDVEVSFGPGLSVLTGETGAGKSLVVDALSLLSGARADAGLVRAGAERLVVEGVYESNDPAVRDLLVESGLLDANAEPDAEVVVRREVAANGRGRLFVNGSPAVVKTLERLAERLLVLYGQAEARELLDPGVPRELLDDFGGLGASRERTREAFGRWRALDDDRRRLLGAGADRATRLALLEFQIGEIDAVSPEPGEEETLAAEKVSLSSVEKRGALLSEAAQALDADEGGALPAVAALKRTFAALADLDGAYASRLAEAADLSERLAELSVSVARDLDRLQADPRRLEEIVGRLDALAKLKRKYGATLDDVRAFRERVGREHQELVDLEGSLRKAEAAAAAAFEEYRSAALELSAARAAAAARLAKAVEKELRDLSFPRAAFDVSLSRREEPESPFEAGGERVAFFAHGVDVVTFSFAPNPGEAPRPLSRIASGGELSRVELALAVALAEEERAAAGGKGTRRGRAPARTLVFDEVDAGVSGATAEAVGRKLRALGRRDQVLVVTHLPQVAAAGVAHHRVVKEVEGKRTRTRVEALDEKGRVEAIAAMLAGSTVTDAARAQARQLLKAGAAT